MIFAVATIDTVIIYSTNSQIPLQCVSNIHFADLSDLSWYNDDMLAIGSMDGYITFCIFQQGELGTP